MNGLSTTSPVIKLLLSMDLLSTLIVIALLGMSVVCVAVVLSKHLAFRAHKKALPLFVERMQRATHFNDLIQIGREFDTTLGGQLLSKVLSDVKDAARTTEGDTRASLSEQDYEHLSLMANQAVEQTIAQEEDYLPLLGTSAAVSPLIGLFGTVWGLIHAFINISQEKSADIAVVAPGIAEALLTTLAGLVVAIPALIFFHYFANDLRKIEHKLFMACDSMLSIIKKTFVR